MANTDKDLIARPYGAGGRTIHLPVDGGSKIYTGSLVAQLAATAMLVAGSTATSGPAVGVAEHTVDNTDGSDEDVRCAVTYDKVFELANDGGDPFSEDIQLFTVAYMVDDHTVSTSSSGGTRQPAGRFVGMSEDGKVRVFVGMNNLSDQLADATDVGIADAGAFTSETDVEGALQELYQDALSAQAFIPIPLGDFVTTADGEALVAFDDGVADGFDWIEGKAYRFNVGSTAAIGTTIPMPPDLDDAADVVVHVLGARVGAADPTAALTVGAFFQTAGAAYDADANAGGDTSAFGAATTVVSEVTRAIAAADVPAAPCALSLSLVPTAALDADDLRVVGVWLEYTRQLRTS